MAFDLTEPDALRSEINVTPLVDVMLVLLVVFMVVTPLVRREIPVDLPRTETSREAEQEVQITLTATADGRILLDGEPLDEAGLADRLRARYVTRPDRTIFLAADRRLSYSRVVDLIDVCRAAGVERIGIVTKDPAPDEVAPRD